MPIANSSDHFTLNNRSLENTLADFWCWSYSDTADPSVRNAIAEYIVASALSVSCCKRFSPEKGYDLISQDGIRLSVRSASYLETADPEHPVNIAFRTSPSLLTSSEKSDAYVFCVFKGMNATDSPLCLDLWDFYVLNAVVLKRIEKKTVTLTTLIQLEPLWCDYYGLETAIKTALNV